MKCINLTGRKYGQLTVLSRADSVIESAGNIRAAWNCICSCGFKVVKTTKSLKTSKNPKCPSCGGRDVDYRFVTKKEKHILYHHV